MAAMERLIEYVKQIATDETRGINKYDDFVSEALGQLPKEDQEFAQEGLARNYFQPADLYSQDFIGQEHDTFEVAKHEIGHEQMAKHYSHYVFAVSVVPHEGTLGYVKSKAISLFRSVEQVVRENIGIFCAGLASEEQTGHKDHEGCRYDLGMAEAMSPNKSFFYEGLSDARRFMGDLGERFITNRAWYLLRKRVLT